MRKIKTVQLAIGVDLLGSMMTLSTSKNIELIEIAHGIEARSKATGRIVVIPFTNIKGYECEPEKAKK